MENIIWKAKKIPCCKCGGKPEICASGTSFFGGPFYVKCKKCSRETTTYCFCEEFAWEEWIKINLPKEEK